MLTGLYSLLDSKPKCKSTAQVLLIILVLAVLLLSTATSCSPVEAPAEEMSQETSQNETSLTPSSEPAESTAAASETSQSETTKQPTPTAIETSAETTEETTEETTQETTQETTAETTRQTTEKAVTTQPEKPAATATPKPLSPYYLYAEKGSYTLVVYGLDSNNKYTKIVKTIRMGIGRGSMTPTGKFTLSTKETWHRFGTYSYAQYAIQYRSSLLIHGPLYKTKDNTTLYPDTYREIGTSCTSGCLRLATGDVLWLYKNVPSGTTLEIVNGTPRGFTKPALIPLIYSNEDPTDPAIKRTIPLPEIKVSSTQPTNQSITVSINYSFSGPIRQYRIGDGDWQTYSGSFAISSNATVLAKGSDYVGNVSGIASYAIKNIDKDPPVNPSVSLSQTDLTNQNITVTIQYGSEDNLEKQYKIDSGSWLSYTEPFSQPENALITARAIDQAGNIAESVLKITNIDKTPPQPPDITLLPLDPAEQITATITYSADSAVRQYRKGADGAWQTYTEPLVITVNTTLFARAADEAGNVSSTEKVIDNIIEP